MAGETPRQRRVLLISPQPFFELRGTPINVLQMVRALCGAGYEVHLATYGLGTPVQIEGLVHHRAMNLPGVQHVKIGFSPRKIGLDALLALLTWRLLLTRRFDVVHAVEEAIFFTLPIARLRGIPVIYDLDSSLPDQLEYSGAVGSSKLLSMARAVEAAALRSSNLAITVCRALTERAQECSPTLRVVQIEDAPLEESLRDPDPGTVQRLRDEYGPGPFIVYTGNMAPYQGVDLLLDALPSLRRRCPEARMLIVGGEPAEIAAARALLTRNGTGEMAIFAGKQPPELMSDFMALATVLVSPRRDGTNTPLKLYTYMYSGVPIVATDLPSHRQVLDESMAVLCRPEPEALAGALAVVLADPAQFAARGAAAREQVRRQFSPAIFARKLLAAYRELLEHPRATA